MAPIVLNTLREWKLVFPRGRLGLVFPNGRGNVESHANIAARGFAVLQRSLGLVDERNSVISSRPGPLSRVFRRSDCKGLLRHSSIQMTFDVYGHWLGDIDDDHQNCRRRASRSFCVPGGGAE